MTRRLPTALELVERLAMGWRPGPAPRRRRARDTVHTSEPGVTEALARALARPAATRVVLDFADDGSVIRASVVKDPHLMSGPWGGPWPVCYPEDGAG